MAFTIDMIWIDTAEVTSTRKREDVKHTICTAANKRMRELRAAR